MENYLFILEKQPNHDICGFAYTRDDLRSAIDVLIENTKNTLQPYTPELREKMLGNEVSEDAIKVYIACDYITTDIDTTLRDFGFRICDECGAWVTPQDRRNGTSTYYDHVRRCPKCVLAFARAQERLNPTLHNYEYHETQNEVRVINADGENYTIDEVKGIGIEVECYNGSRHQSTTKATREFYALARPDATNRMFRCEQDGTVSFEIISNVFTKRSLYDFNFSILTDVLKLNGNIDGNKNAGVHVHLSHTWLGDTAKEQCLNFLKLQYFMHCYENDFFKLCGRKDRDDAMYYCKFFSEEEIDNMRYYVQTCNNPWDYMPNDHGGGDGCALNRSGKTIEWRIGANTNDPQRLRNYILFILGITENIKNVPFSKIYCLGKVTRLVPNEVMNYWRSKGCFLNTNATSDRGENI